MGGQKRETSNEGYHDYKRREWTTWALGFDQVKHLAEEILEGQRFDAHSFHPLTLLLVEILQLKHGEDAVAVCVHAPEPVLDTKERYDVRLHTSKTSNIHHTHKKYICSTTQNGATPTWWDSSCPPQIWGTRQTQRSSSFLLSAPRYPWKQGRAIHSQCCQYGAVISWSVFGFASTYRVTAPENNLSMILLEDAVGRENQDKYTRCDLCSNTQRQVQVQRVQSLV